MEAFDRFELRESFERFEKAAMKGHEESQLIWDVVKDMALKRENKGDIEKAFAETESPLGYYFAGLLCDLDSRERFEYMKKSSDGCSWGQVQYAWSFNPYNPRRLVEEDKMYLELIEKAVAQNNPEAIYWRGQKHEFWRGQKHEGKGEYEEALADYRRAAELGWHYAKAKMSVMLYDGNRVEKDLVQTVYWGSKADDGNFWNVLHDATKAWNNLAFRDLGCDFNRLAMEIGKGLYWYQSGTEEWEKKDEAGREFGIKCLDYYCETIELQQEAICLFLLFWNKTTGVKGPGQMIGQMVWEGRYDCLVKEFGE